MLDAKEMKYNFQSENINSAPIVSSVLGLATGSVAFRRRLSTMKTEQRNSIKNLKTENSYILTITLKFAMNARVLTKPFIDHFKPRRC